MDDGGPSSRGPWNACQMAFSLRCECLVETGIMSLRGEKKAISKYGLGIIYPIISGNLITIAQNYPAFEDILHKIYEGSKDKPSIYYRLRLDDSGRAPNVIDCLPILGAMEEYLQGKGLQLVKDMVHVEKPVIPMAKTSYGYHKYTWISKGSKTAQTYVEYVSIVHVRNQEWVITNPCMRLSISKKAKHSEPLQYSSIEIGYLNRSPNHLKSHAIHRSSNYAICLAKAFLSVSSHVALAEATLTRSTEGYMGNGGEIGHYPHDMSHDSHSKPSKENRMNALDMPSPGFLWSRIWRSIVKFRMQWQSRKRS
ncbi:hypothetical protein P154DRAFT_583492 [Amniculicola lignicola CBS 123094]|uniref:Uncharacterized protein n=1 Tax=Amniculicola lignicola CBS 123094 TaxID=1392246 RepID=A0A6A5VV77_9PLEO|nr:hypothetical protein P154DRAFT_583492 [Amniculicola lignicola CBS 123094]